MFSNLRFAIYLALRDWCFERTMTICSVLALASMLMPLLVLQGVRTGVIEAMQNKLLADPQVLIITPRGGTRTNYTQADIHAFANLPGAIFCLGRTREIATDITLEGPTGKLIPVHFEPCAPGEPLLTQNHLPIPQAAPKAEVLLSARAQMKLHASIGDTILAKLGRKNHQGRLESLDLPLTLVGILPDTLSDRVLGFLPLELLEDIEDFRDDLAVPRRGFSGRPRLEARTYASFRLYAKDLDSVAPLTKELAQLGIETRTKVREIAQIKTLEQALNRIIFLLAVAVGTGFVAFMLSSTRAALRRKQRQLGLLRLFGFGKPALILYPLSQTWLTALTGLSMAFLVYLLVSVGIDYVFLEQSQGITICHLHIQDFLLTSVSVIILASLGAFNGAQQAACIDPATVMRDV
ncbi:MAG: hypothetical protein IJU79_05175 [Desulfovibrionaceae bacterium]|nr:hypothetical protein [Desulfovibrionaceae bacterium]